MIIKPKAKARKSTSCIIINGEQFYLDGTIFSEYTALEFSLTDGTPTIAVAIDQQIDRKTIEMFITACQNQQCDWSGVNPYGVLRLAQAFQTADIEESITEYIKESKCDLFGELHAAMASGENATSILDAISGLFPAALENPALRERLLSLPVNTIHCILARVLASRELDSSLFIRFASDYISRHGKRISHPINHYTISHQRRRHCPSPIPRHRLGHRQCLIHPMFP